MRLYKKYYFYILRGELSEIGYIDHLLNVINHKNYIVYTK